jgi:thioredoxin-like negative regulator of GroEL
MLKQLNKETFDLEVLDSTEKVAVLFHAEEATPAVYTFLNMEQYPVYHVNLDETPEVGAILGIRALPTLYVFDAGALQSFKVGYMSKEDIEIYLRNEGVISEEKENEIR